MRELKYKDPVKLRSSRIENGKRLYDSEGKYYNRFSTVYTKHGIVTVLEFNWQTNSGKIIFTEFNTVFNGLIYSADIEEARLSEIKIKWLSTHFIKTILKIK